MCCLCSLRSMVLFLFLFMGFLSARSFAGEQPTKKVLILVEGKTDPRSYAVADGRQLAMLLGHFNTSTVVKGVDEYVARSLRMFDIAFYIGFRVRNTVPAAFVTDVLETQVPIVWIHTGFAEMSSTYPVDGQFGFHVSHIDSVSQFDRVEHNGAVFDKEDPNTDVIVVTDQRRVRVLATAFSTKVRRRTPYIVQSGTLSYIADSPFSYASASDRYILFADLLHDFLGEDHEESHSAIIRIEDVNPMENPDKLRDVADILSSRGIPFLVGVSPFYVNPELGTRVSLSDKPDIVDALKYMVRNGGSIVMHGVTHQYKGVTGTDFEFWDESGDRPIRNETAEGFERKLDMGIQEFMKNGLYPLLWETPHYGGSQLFYRVVATYFSTCIEQKLAIEDIESSQFFPYIIRKDLFGQRIYPENLGYVPLSDDINVGERAVARIIRDARTTLAVRDGFATCFFHAFVNTRFLEEIVDSIRGMGYTYIDPSDSVNWVKTKDRVILTGSQKFSVTLNDQYLTTSTFDSVGDLVEREVSDTRLTGIVERSVTLEPGQVFKAEPTEYRERQVGFFERTTLRVKQLVKGLVSSEETWAEARPVILWNHHARGAAYDDQASLASVFRSVNIHLDTIFVGQDLHLDPYNVLIVPFSFVDSLQEDQYNAIDEYVRGGGNLITDTKNYLIENYGFEFSKNVTKITRIQDRLFPEERITWKFAEPFRRVEAGGDDEVFCIDNATGAPLILGRNVGKGKILFVATRFDPYSTLGYSHYPFFLEYVRRYFRVAPIVRREALEMYFDPGFRHSQSIEVLVQQWVREGIRRIHVAGWHEYPRYTYDYERLIRLAHANGILVYVWLEPPQVSQKFWLDHPEWREKNYRGEDAAPAWRYAVALTDDRCVGAMVKEYMTLLQSFDWDGVNLAELYFESGTGFQDPEHFAPMHASAQAQVLQRYNIQLRSIFTPSSAYYWKANPAVHDALVEYRIDRLSAVYRRLLDAFQTHAAQKSGFIVIVTAMDSYGSPELRENLGVDMKSILALQKQYKFHLQVEDPQSRWSTDPQRYLQMGKDYERYLGDRQHLMLDLNILPFRSPEKILPFPTLIQTGTESFDLVRSASLGAPRMTIYAESSINPQDYPWFSAAIAGDVQYRPVEGGYAIESPVSYVLKLPRTIQEVVIDGAAQSPMRDNLFLVPAGEHSIMLTRDVSGTLSSHQFYPRLLSITGNLLSLGTDLRSLQFVYDADERCLASINSVPREITVDGASISFQAMKGNDCYTVLLPPGHHQVEIIAGDPFSYGVNLTSFWSTTAIALFGLVAVLLLLTMYLVVVWVRRRLLVGAQ